MVPGMDESRRWACFSRTWFLVARCPTRPRTTATRPRCEGCAGNEMETSAPFGNEDGNEPKKGGGDGNEKGQKEGVLVAVGNAAPASAGRAGGEQSPKPAEPQVASADKSSLHSPCADSTAKLSTIRSISLRADSTPGISARLDPSHRTILVRATFRLHAAHRRETALEVIWARHSAALAGGGP